MTKKLIDKINSLKFEGFELIMYYRTNRTYIVLKCIKHGEIFRTSLDKIKNKTPMCKKCRPKIEYKPNGNSIYDIRPDLIKFLKNKEDASKYSIKSDKLVHVVCDICGKEREIKVQYLSSQKSFCKNCRDGTSFPEKFISNLLDELNVEYIKEYSPDWIGKKRYDFYIPDINTIIETHGAQHYKDSSYHKFICDIDNDIFKKEEAIKNGISKYICINCSNTKFNNIVTETKKSISNIFNLDDINWDRIYVNADKNIYKNIISKYKSKNSIKEISEQLNISIDRVKRNLTRANKLGTIKYNKMETSTGINVAMCDKHGNILKKYRSISKASESVGYSTNIIKLLIKNKKDRDGFFWILLDKTI